MEEEIKKLRELLNASYEREITLQKHFSKQLDNHRDDLLEFVELKSKYRTLRDAIITIALIELIIGLYILFM